MNQLTLQDLEANHPTVYPRAKEISEQLHSKTQRAHYLRDIFIQQGSQHVAKEFDCITDASGHQQFLCVECSVGPGPFYPALTSYFLFEDEEEFLKARTDWSSRG